ncbi:DNA polymerase IV (plasmid) [Azospirillum baldaniorum]|uniref:DNA polymerase IV n=1 Tax=Azospirillum baldaniorum TaxID=1064539 RepID=A0A9P1NPS6_9PROT|nr:DNA polymerase IV [Azospirillum baldaniorum]AWJ91083.1 DNA polymerase IV [Azospirillum baldaniorum]TWA57986.1 DNA polymerase-4 [Azospirillum baldaniorum]TWA72353.1 DNA polymerase-4 [Azospirillum brasilense]CCD01108.1 DNA polymerase IV, devoid of proofreading,damage-inducible protein P [Azospirillum baldaniorum]
MAVFDDCKVLCRDCAAALRGSEPRCSKCGGRRLVRHEELHGLAIGHIDCDAFYATVEKRDRPELVSRPLIIGGDRRGVVAACCYIARMAGVRSAMPMWQALEACPDAVVLRPDMAKYKTVGRQARELMHAFTPLVEPLSIDEAFLDLSGVAERLSISPAQALAELVRRFENQLGITASVGLSYNKLFAKIASDLEKPRGFSVIGRGQALDFLAPKPVSILWGVGPVLQRKLQSDGIRTVGDLRGWSEIDLVRRHGKMGRLLHRFARGQDDRRVEPESPSKSISAETTFDWETADKAALKDALLPLAETVARRLSAAGLRGRSVVLKMKTADFQTITRSRRVDPPARSAGLIWQTGCEMLDAEPDGRSIRLIGVGCTDLLDPETEAEPGLFDGFGPSPPG